MTYSLGRWHHAKLYGEFRYHKAYQSDVQTIVWPLTVGLALVRIKPPLSRRIEADSIDPGASF